MKETDRDMAIKRIVEMPEEQIVKVLIFMAGMEAECATRKSKDAEKEDDCVRAS